MCRLFDYHCCYTNAKLHYGCDLIRRVKHNSTSEWPLDIQILSSKQVHCMKANVTAATLLLCGGFLCYPQGLVYGSSRSGVNRGKAAWRRWRRAQWKTKITLLVTSDVDTEAETQEAESKRENWNSIVWLLFGFKTSDTNQTMWICKTCRQQVVTSDS